METTTTTAITTTITSFTIGYNSSSDNKNQYKITILRKSQVLVLTHEGMPELNGVYIPEHKMPWNGALKQSFNDLVEYIDNDETIWERTPLEKLAQEGQLSAFVHRGFWQPMDTLRDKTYLEELWNTGQAPWKVWQ